MTAQARRRVAVVCRPERCPDLRPLMAEYASVADVTHWPLLPRETPTQNQVAEIAGEADAVLVVGDRRRSPRTVLGGPVVDTHDGRVVPVGWVPDLGSESVTHFAVRSAQVHRRQESGARCTVAVLAQRSRRYRNLAARIHRLLRVDNPDAAVSWTADDLMAEDMVGGLGLGLGLACYVGHGRPVGWVGYRGIRSHHLALRRPLGAMVSLTCLTASRRRVGLSFAEAIVMAGAAGASVGAVVPTDHRDNGRWAYRMCRAVVDGARDVGELVVAARPAVGPCSYRLIGDPLAPLADAAGGRKRAVAHTDRYVMTCDPA